jgi:hypothetical protein
VALAISSERPDILVGLPLDRARSVIGGVIFSVCSRPNFGSSGQCVPGQFAREASFFDVQEREEAVAPSSTAAQKNRFFGASGKHVLCCLDTELQAKSLQWTA